jgi:hypothetical protein
VLEQFDEATKVLSGRNYPTIFLGNAVIRSLSYYLTSKSNDSLEAQMKAFLLNTFNQYMGRDGEEAVLVQVSALLDPLTHDLLTLEDKQTAEAFIIKEVA